MSTAVKAGRTRRAGGPGGARAFQSGRHFAPGSRWGQSVDTQGGHGTRRPREETRLHLLLCRAAIGGRRPCEEGRRQRPGAPRERGASVDRGAGSAAVGPARRPPCRVTSPSATRATHRVEPGAPRPSPRPRRAVPPCARPRAPSPGRARAAPAPAPAPASRGPAPAPRSDEARRRGRRRLSHRTRPRCHRDDRVLRAHDRRQASRPCTERPPAALRPTPRRPGVSPAPMALSKRPLAEPGLLPVSDAGRTRAGPDERRSRGSFAGPLRPGGRPSRGDSHTRSGSRPASARAAPASARGRPRARSRRPRCPARSRSGRAAEPPRSVHPARRASPRRSAERSSTARRAARGVRLRRGSQAPAAGDATRRPARALRNAPSQLGALTLGGSVGAADRCRRRSRGKISARDVLGRELALGVVELRSTSGRAGRRGRRGTARAS